MYSRQKLYEGKAKIIYATDEPGVLLVYFKDDATAFNAQKRGEIVDKGRINCEISTHLFRLLEAKGVATHWIDSPGERQMRVWAVDITPLEVVVRNIAAGSLCRQTTLALGSLLQPPLVEFYFKNDGLGDPLLTHERLLIMKLATEQQLAQLIRLAQAINVILSDFFRQCEITLVDFKVEFGLDTQQHLLLADEISPDTCRLWDQSEADINRRILDKDRFRQDLGHVEEAYQQVLARILAHISQA